MSQVIVIDLLQSDVIAAYASRPALLRERFANTQGKRIVLDEIQKIPALLDEVHWLIENKGLAFLLTGSSARKLRRGQANLLGGRAWKRVMLPLCSQEVDTIDLEAIMFSGLLPPHFLATQPLEHLRSYVSDYLREEIVAEGLTQNLPAFADFLRIAAFSNGELVNYTNIARDTGVSAKVIRTYFDILRDTYLGSFLALWRKAKRRRLILTEKFYDSDVGISNYLCKRQPKMGSHEFGKSFEQYIWMECNAYRAYRQPEMDMTYWHTSTGLEVDFILNNCAVAIDCKAGRLVHPQDLKGLKALMEEQTVGQALVVALEPYPRWIQPNIQVLPWQDVLTLLWAGALGM